MLGRDEMEAQVMSHLIKENRQLKQMLNAANAKASEGAGSDRALISRL